MTAEDKLEHFQWALTDALQSIRNHEVVVMRSKDEAFTIGAINVLFGPVKKEERVKVKVDEYKSEHKSEWPFIKNVRSARVREGLACARQACSRRAGGRCSPREHHLRGWCCAA